MSSSFTDTRWSLVERSQGADEPARAALSELCAIYYQPVHRFIASWCREDERSRDLTQDFFAAVLAKHSFDGADESRGRFRAYLLGAVKHFLCDAALRERAAKRQGSVVHVKLDDQLDDIRTLPPDAIFDRQWTLTLLDRVLAQLQSAMASDGKAEVFAALKPWLSGHADHGHTTQAARELQTSETAVRVLLHRLRQRFRTMLRQELAQTLNERADLEAEMRHLLESLRG